MSFETTIIANAIADGIARWVDHLTRPKKDPLQLLMSVLPMLPPILQALKPPVPIDNDGPQVQGVKCELAAEEAHLQAAFAERHARLMADFAPRLQAAHAADGQNAARESQFPGDQALESAAVAVAVGESDPVRTSGKE